MTANPKAPDPTPDWPTPGSVHDAALGAVFGALAGDAAGAVLEMQQQAPTAGDVDRAMRFPGGGFWMVAPGQVTDDGELTMCLLQALAESRAYEPDTVAKWYGRWYRSDPFDIGDATRAGLAPAITHSPEQPAGLALAMSTSARARSMTSKANGSLMRATPLGVWGRELDADTLAAVARADSALTHPNPSCGDAVAAYVIAIASLLRAPGDRSGAFGAARSWAEREACAEVRGWLDDAEHSRKPAYVPKAGFVKIAFTEAFRHLLLGTPWDIAVRETLLGGGDTDTNACIVGGITGAAGGAFGVVVRAREAVLASDHVFGRVRPSWLHPREVPGLLTRVMGDTS